MICTERICLMDCLFGMKTCFWALLWVLLLQILLIRSWYPNCKKMSVVRVKKHLAIRNRMVLSTQLTFFCHRVTNKGTELYLEKRIFSHFCHFPEFYSLFFVYSWPYLYYTLLFLRKNIHILINDHLFEYMNNI